MHDGQSLRHAQMVPERGHRMHGEVPQSLILFSFPKAGEKRNRILMRRDLLGAIPPIKAEPLEITQLIQLGLVRLIQRRGAVPRYWHGPLSLP